MGLRGRLKKAEKAAKGDVVEVRLKDGTARWFPKTDVMKEHYLAQLDAALRRPRSEARQSEVMDALDNATPESREAVLREHPGRFMADLEPADPDAPPVVDLSE